MVREDVGVLDGALTLEALGLSLEDTEPLVGDGDRDGVFAARLGGDSAYAEQVRAAEDANARLSRIIDKYGAAGVKTAADFVLVEEDEEDDEEVAASSIPPARQPPPAPAP